MMNELEKFKETVSQFGFKIHNSDFYKSYIIFKIPLKNGYSKRLIGIPNGNFTFRGFDYREDEIRLHITISVNAEERIINRVYCRLNELHKLKKYLKRIMPKIKKGMIL